MNVAILALPILVLLIAGFLALIIYAIISKKWALLFIPLGLVMLFTVFVGLHFVSSRQSQHLVRDRATAAHIQAVQDTHVRQGNSSNETAQVAEYSVDSNVKATRSRSNVVHTSVTPNFAFSSLILLMAFVALVVLVIIAAIRKKWALLFIPLGFAGLAVVSVLLLRFVHMPTSSSNTLTQIAAPARNASPDQNYSISADRPLPSVWSPGMEKEFTASNYYSIPSALRGVACRLDQMVRQQALSGQVMPEKLALVVYKDRFSEEWCDIAIGVFQEILPDTKCYIAPAGKDSFTSKDMWVSLDITDSTNSAQGTIEAYIHVKHNSNPVRAKFTEKPWLESFDSYCNARPGNHYLIAYSQNPGASSGSAKAQAENRATQIVAERVFQIARSLPQYDGRVANYSISRDDLWNYGLVEDQFAQSLSGKASNIHRQAILLNLLPQNVQRLAENKLGVYNAARQSWAYHIMSAIGIALVICVIYLILNAATKGYYTVVLRILTVIGIIAVVLLLTI
ncbi:MAG: hypothetical protein K9M75_11760 [Phycisphaerae bacterium]|nr:hypothetical protein [Phycisphaerae bacterium]